MKFGKVKKEEAVEGKFKFKEKKVYSNNEWKA